MQLARAMKELPKIRIYIDGQPQELKRAEKPVIASAQVRVHWTEEDKAIAKKEEDQKPPAGAVTLDGLKKDREMYDQLKIQQGELYRAKAKINNYLVDLPEDAPQADAKALIDQITGIKQVYNMNAVLLRYYDKNGRFPEPEEVKEKPKLSEMDKAELMQRRANLRPNISKAKNAIIKYQRNPEKLVQYEQKLASLQAELSQIDERLIHG